MTDCEALCRCNKLIELSRFKNEPVAVHPKVLAVLYGENTTSGNNSDSTAFMWHQTLELVARYVQARMRPPIQLTLPGL